jgi:hypothetical protein
LIENISFLPQIQKRHSSLQTVFLVLSCMSLSGRILYQHEDFTSVAWELSGGSNHSMFLEKIQQKTDMGGNIAAVRGLSYSSIPLEEA